MLEGRKVEIQVRTVAQDAWAQVVESLDERFGWDLEHGRGPAGWLEWLHAFSDELGKLERAEPYMIPATPFDMSPES